MNIKNIIEKYKSTYYNIKNLKNLINKKWKRKK